MKPETEFSLSVLLLAALAVPIHSVAMSLIRSAGIVSMLYVPAVVIAVWIVVWRRRAGLHERPPIGLLITLPLATAEFVIVALCLGLVALVGALGWELGDSQWPSIDTFLLPIAKYTGLAITAALLGLLLRACRSGRGLELLTYLALGVSGLLRHTEMRQVGRQMALGEDFPSRHVDWIAFLIPLVVGTLFIIIGTRSPNGKRATYGFKQNA
jgi:hypothetical protein